MPLPEHGLTREEVLAQMRAEKARDADWRGGRTFSLIYPAGPAVDAMLRDAAELYLYENALNPFRFPGLRALEDRVVEITGELLHAPAEFGGSFNSGGTESILLAVLAARERARKERGVREPALLVPRSAHPAFAKAAHYLGLRHLQIPLAADYRADPSAADALLREHGDRIALVAGSAPNYPFGVVDPIPELAAMAAARGIPFHTDACLGGFLLPFYEALGESVPAFDFRVPGVTTLSADVHKYGYCIKGASVLLHRRRADLLNHQLFLYDGWPGGTYGSFGVAGARSSAPIAAAYAVLHHLGREGYLALARRVRDNTRRLRAGLAAIPGLRLLGDPAMSVLAFTAAGYDIFAVADRMDARGWHLDRQTGPDALHLMLSPEHDRVLDRFLGDLRECACDAASGTRSAAREARYS
jgi:glutamate/tyrosine decarboxylase-like PLP-dependent enzyme